MTKEEKIQNEEEQNKSTETIKKNTKIGKISKVLAKSSLWTVMHARSIIETLAILGALAFGTHVYKQFNKTPKEAKEDTKRIVAEVEHETESWFSEESNDSKTRQKADDVNSSKKKKSNLEKATSAITGTGAYFGSALREWIVEKSQKK